MSDPVTISLVVAVRRDGVAIAEDTARQERTVVLELDRLEGQVGSAVTGDLLDEHHVDGRVLDLFRAKEVIMAVDATGPVEQIQAAIREQLGVEMSSV